MRSPKYTKRNLPSVFNFKVNPCHLHPDDWDLLFTLEKDSVGNVWICYWVDPIDKRVKTTLYNTKEVLEFVNGYSWLVEGVDFPIDTEDFEVKESENQYYHDHLGY